MEDYKRLSIKEFSRNPLQTTPEGNYWKKFKFPVLSKQYAAVTHLEFSPVKPHDFAVTSSTRVTIYNAETNAVKRTISRFKDVAHGGSWRRDGKLIVAGGANAIVQVFDVSTRSVLRTMRGHTGEVHAVRFSNDNVHVGSASDDKTVKLWDLGTFQALHTWSGHQDYVRCLRPHPVSDSIWITGSYDHSVRLWDSRVPAGQACVMTLTHGSPLEDLVVFPGAGLLASAGGSNFKMWDMLAGGRLLHTAEAAQKTITSLCLDGQGERLLTGSLDGHLRVHDVSTYRVIHTMKYPAPILCCGVSPNGSHLVVGMASSMLSIRQRSAKKADPLVVSATASTAASGASRTTAEPNAMHGGTYRYFLRGKNLVPAASDHIVEKGRKARLKDYDLYLKKFQYKNALDAALNAGRPVIGVSLLEELVHREALRIALCGRDEAGLEPVLTFITKHITNPRYSSLLIDVADMLFEIYAGVLGQSAVIDTLFVQLNTKLRAEIKFQQHLTQLLGTMEIILAAGARMPKRPVAEIPEMSASEVVV